MGELEPERPGSAGRPSATSGRAPTAGSSSRRRRRPSCGSPGRSAGLYWRATTLDQFDSDRWLENPTPLSTGPRDRQAAERPAAAGPLAEPQHLGPPGRRGGRAPRHAHHRRRAAGRARRHPASAASSTSRAASRASTTASSGGSATRSTATRRGPEPAELARARGRVPARARPLPRHRPHARRPLRRRPAATALVDGLFDGRPLPRALAVPGACGTRRSGCAPTRGRRTAPSSRSRPGCARPAASPTTSRRRRPAGLPPLAHFVAEGKRGYCQHFAGAMALMLRLLGIPARVAAGFTSGKHEDGGWTVTDHNAHAWVEVWFPGYGWLPFDPTPGRGSLAANYSASSTGFNAGDAADGFVRGASGVNGGGADQLRLLAQKERLAEQAQAGRSAGGRGPERRVAARPARARCRSARSVSPSSCGGAAATSPGIRGVWPARPAASSSTSSPTRGIAVSAERDARGAAASSCRPSSAPTAGRSPAALAEARFGPPEGERRRREPRARELRKLCCACSGTGSAGRPACAACSRSARCARDPGRRDRGRPRHAAPAADRALRQAGAAGRRHAGDRAPAARARRRGRRRTYRRHRATSAEQVERLSATAAASASTWRYARQTAARRVRRRRRRAPRATALRTSSSAPTRLSTRRRSVASPRAYAGSRRSRARSPSSRGRAPVEIARRAASGACSDEGVLGDAAVGGRPGRRGRIEALPGRAAVRALDRVSASDRRGRAR